MIRFQVNLIGSNDDGGIQYSVTSDSGNGYAVLQREGNHMYLYISKTIPFAMLDCIQSGIMEMREHGLSSWNASCEGIPARNLRSAGNDF